MTTINIPMLPLWSDVTLYEPNLDRQAKAIGQLSFSFRLLDKSTQSQLKRHPIGLPKL